MVQRTGKEDLIKQYLLAGKIRFISFALLFLFLFLMKLIGGYEYLNGVFILLIFVEAILNQPYRFILKHVNINRFKYYQMTTDIIAISWAIYYMGGVEAPLISIAYYVVILWAGVVSTTGAVFFAVISSAVFFSAVVILEYFGLIPSISYYQYAMSIDQFFSLLAGNIAFMFAFGYFSARSSWVVRYLQRQKQEETLRNVHKLMATAYLVGNTSHDVLNCLVSIKGYTEILLDTIKPDTDEGNMLVSIKKLGNDGINLLSRLFSFSKDPDRKPLPTDIHQVIEGALELTWPLTRYSKMKIEKSLGTDIPQVLANKDQLKEVFVALILNALDATEQGFLRIATVYKYDQKSVEISFVDTGCGVSRENLQKLGEPFFTTKEDGKGHGLGLASAYGIIHKHKGNITVHSIVNEGTTVTITLPV